MIRDDELPELQELRRSEAEFPIRTDTTLADKVIAADNETQPVHRWFKFKESFAPALLKKIVLQLYPSGMPKKFSILDPFTGVGTTLLAAEQLAADDPSAAIHTTGIERNPFIHFAARTKVNWRHVQYQHLLRIGERAIEPPRTGPSTCQRSLALGPVAASVSTSANASSLSSTPSENSLAGRPAMHSCWAWQQASSRSAKYEKMGAPFGSSAGTIHKYARYSPANGSKSKPTARHSQRPGRQPSAQRH